MKRFEENPYFYPLLLVAATFLTYAGIYDFQFLYDDEFLIQKNRFLESFSYLGDIFTSNSTGGAGFKDSFYRPMQTLAYLLVRQIFDGERWAHHLLNVGLHAANAVLMFTLARKLGLKARVAALVSALWAVHPLHNEAVTYMSATADPLHALFLLSGLVVAAPAFTGGRLAIAMGFFILGLLSKESAIVFPALLFTLCYFFSQRSWHWRAYLPTVPFWLVALGYFISRRTWLNISDQMYTASNVYTENILFRVYTFLATIPGYIELTVWPHDLHMDRQFSVYVNLLLPPVLMGLAAVLVLIALGWWSRWWAWVGLWLLAAHVPQSGILIPVNSFFLEHWMYVPLIGVFIGLGKAFEKYAADRRPWTYAVGVAACVALAIATFRQNGVWATPVSFFSHILRYNPDADRVRHNLAMALSDQGMDDQALVEYQKVVQRTQQYAEPYHNMGRIYAKRGQIELAEQNYLKAIQISADFFPAYAELAQLYARKGDMQKALEYKAKYDQLTRR
ncbi:MAG TPA: tetratricopeptide repeat protein [Bdellovibrionales bacterium]|nr:tetratricopeptide repeat protein [Bdellovibrionales bacterium]